uniref:Aquaporin-9 n=1 Tax=Ascaris lumbricoides TaxID=6252 RepID=A0A0M3HNW4_ASCLU
MLTENHRNTSVDWYHPMVVSNGSLHYMERWRQNYRIKNRLIANLIAEFYATAILRFIGTGVIAQLVLSRGTANAPVQVNLGWGFAISLSVYSAWRTSGGHVNPAVTAALFILGKISFVHSLLYVVAQMFGAAFGAGLSYIVYYEAINNFDGGVRALDGVNGTGFIFASFPASYLSNSGAFIDQVAGTGLLGLFVAFFCEQRNQIPLFLQPALFGVVAAMIGTCYSMNMGSPVNPASDFGPRILAVFLGYGTEMLTYHDYFFWIPLLAPVVGAVLGAYSYVFFIGFHIPDLVDSRNANSSNNGKHTLKAIYEDGIPLKQNEIFANRSRSTSKDEMDETHGFINRSTAKWITQVSAAENISTRLHRFSATSFNHLCFFNSVQKKKTH